MSATHTNMHLAMEAVLLNNRGVGHLMIGETRHAIQCLTKAMEITGKAAQDGMIEEEEATMKVSAVEAVSIPDLDDGFAFYSCNQAYLMDPHAFEVDENSTVPYLDMFIVVMYNVGLAVHQSALFGDSSKAAKAIRYYSLCLQAFNARDSNCPVGLALCAAATVNMAQLYLCTFSEKGLASSILGCWKEYLSPLTESGKHVLGEHLDLIVFQIMKADSLRDMNAAAA